MNNKSKSILFLSYSDTRFDGRLRELYNVISQLGEVYSVIRYNEKIDLKNERLEYGNISIKEFVKRSKAMADKMPKVDIIFVDNRMACIPGLLLKRKYREAILIQDMRELLISKEQKSLKTKIGCLIEKQMIKKANIVICANKYRAKKMKELYKFNDELVIYENIRELSYKSDIDLQIYDKKYENIFKNDTIKIISTSGYAIMRTNDQLLRELNHVKEKVELLMVGGGDKKDKLIMEEIIKEEELKNVHIIDKIEESELKYLISKSQIGIVNYGQYDTNNKLCASGKIYEFLFEGLPVVTTSNLPLKDFCEKFQIGVSGDSYSKAINRLIEDYDYYYKNVLEFKKKYDSKNNNQRLLNKLIGIIGK